jgi:suppressor of G2 allele of SKP1
MSDAYSAALSAFIGERFEQVISLLERVPVSCAALTLRAAAQLRLGRLSDAQSSISRAKQTSDIEETINLNAQYWSGVVAFNSGDFAAAVGIFGTLSRQCAETKYSEWLRKAEAEQRLRGQQKPFTWTQTNQNVILRFPLPGNFKQRVVAFGERELSVTLVVEGGAEKHLAFDLFERVKKADCTSAIENGTLVLTMPKQTADLTWSTLEFKEEVAKSLGAPAYPTSSRTKKDWSRVDRLCDAELRTETAQGEAALNGFFRQIYANADEESKRAMMKSFQTSGGTVLSTNWTDVKEKDYEGKDRPDAPEGQKWSK